jgi:hypothetical protein
VAVIEEDPASSRVQELAARYIELLRKLVPTGQLNPQVMKYAAAYLSTGDWPEGAPQPEPPFGGKRVWEFMARAVHVRQ